MYDSEECPLEKIHFRLIESSESKRECLISFEFPLKKLYDFLSCGFKGSAEIDNNQFHTNPYKVMFLFNSQWKLSKNIINSNKLTPRATEIISTRDCLPQNAFMIMRKGIVIDLLDHFAQETFTR